MSHQKSNFYKQSRIISITLILFLTGCSDKAIKLDKNDEPIINISTSNNNNIQKPIKISSQVENLTISCENLRNDLWTGLYLNDDLYIAPIQANKFNYTITKQDNSTMFSKGENVITLVFYKEKNSVPTKLSKSEKNTYQLKYTII